MRMILVVGMLFTGACSNLNTQTAAIEYKIAVDGAATTENENTYATLGDRTFYRVQKYKVVAQGEEGRNFHVLIGKFTQKRGDKIEAVQEGYILPISDGIGSIECRAYYDVKTDVKPSDVKDPVCTLEPRGVLIPSAPAKLIS